MPAVWEPSDIDLGDLGDWYEQDSEPSSPETGDKWLDTSESPPVWKWWTGSQWMELGSGGGESGSSLVVDDDLPDDADDDTVFVSRTGAFLDELES